MLPQSSTLFSRSWKKRLYSSVYPTTPSSLFTPGVILGMLSKKPHMLVRGCLDNVCRVTEFRLWADCGWIFAQHFCNRLGPAYLQLRNVLDETNPAHAEVLNNIKRRFREETFTRESIQQVIHAYPELVSYPSPISLYGDSPLLAMSDSHALREFRYGPLPGYWWCIPINVSLFAILALNTNLIRRYRRPTLSYQRLQTAQPLSDAELYDKIRRTVPNKHELQVLEAFLIFNKYAIFWHHLTFKPNRQNRHIGTFSRRTFINRRKSHCPSASRLISYQKLSIPESHLACSLWSVSINIHL